MMDADPAPRSTHELSSAAELEQLRRQLAAAEQRVQAGESRYRMILDSAVDYAVIALDLDGLVTEWNEGARRILGWTEKEMLGRPAAIFFTEEDRQAGVPQAEMRAAQCEGRGIDERWHQRKDGSRFWANGEMMPLMDEASTIQGFIKVLRDRTEQHLASEALKAVYERFGLAQRATRDAIWDWNFSDNSVLWNEALEEAYGWAPGHVEPTGDWWIAQIHPEDRDRIDQSIHAVIDGAGTSWTDEYRFRRADGSYAEVLDRGHVIRSPEGRALRMIGAMLDVSHRKQAETALAESQAEADRQRRLYEAILNNTPDLAYVWGLDHRFSYANDVLLRMWGKTWDEAIGRNCLELGYADWHAAMHDREIEQVIATKQPVRGEVPFAGTFGRRIYDYILVPVIGASGEVEAVAGTTRDVTEARETEAALKRNAERVQLALSAGAIIGTWHWNIPMDRFTIDGAFARSFGLDPALGREGIPLADIVATVHPDDQAGLAAAIQEAIGRGGAYAHQYRVRRTDGEYYWIEANGRVEHGLDGTPQSFPGVLLDVQERRAVEMERDRVTAELRALTETLEQRVIERTRALRDSQDFARLALSAVGGVGVWTYDIASDRFTCDASISALYGLDVGPAAAGVSREEFLANVHPEDLSALRRTMAAGLAQSGDLELEYRIRHPDGSVRWVLSRGHTYFDDEGRPVRRTGVGVETTRQRQVEEQLRQSQKMEAVGQLTGGLAHDFNNLLTGVTGSLELLQNRIAQGRLSEVDRFVQAAQGAAKRAAALTQRLLAFSRRQTLDPKPTNVNRLVSGMEELLQRTVGPVVEVEVVGAAGLWATHVDPGQLENALLNLCINARDAMPDGGKITIETGNRWLDERTARERDLPPGQYISLCVSDTGAGMTPDVVSRAFDPFFTTKPIGMGTGLGLSMVYGFAKQSGGQVRIYSEVEQGTMVCLYLPRHLGEEEAGEAAPELADAPRAEEGQTVLVVDDEPTVRMLVTEVLEELGYIAIEAADGAAALKVLQSEVPLDLLITDVGLPGGMNGRQVADAARVARAELKVLFITGYAENAVLSHGHLDPGMHVLTKPFAMEVLANRIREMTAEG